MLADIKTEDLSTLTRSPEHREEKSRVAKHPWLVICLPLLSRGRLKRVSSPGHFRTLASLVVVLPGWLVIDQLSQDSELLLP